jgi:hypothetical protein
MNGALCDVMHSGNRFDGVPFQPTAEAIFMNSIPNVALARKTAFTARLFEGDHGLHALQHYRRAYPDVVLPARWFQSIDSPFTATTPCL